MPAASLCFYSIRKSLLTALVTVGVFSTTGFADQASSAEKAALIEVKGFLVPVKQARIASRAQGLISEICQEGDEVSQGSPLVTLEMNMEELQVAQQLQVLELRAFEAQSAAELAQKNVISRTEAEEKRITHEIAKVQLAQAREFLDRKKVLAPFDGIVTERLREVGEAVDEFTPVLVLSKIDELFFETFLPAHLKASIIEGAEVTVRPLLGGEPVVGRIERAVGTINPASGEFKVRIRLPNTSRSLIPGSQATALLPVTPSAPSSPTMGSQPSAQP